MPSRRRFRAVFSPFAAVAIAGGLLVGACADRPPVAQAAPEPLASPYVGNHFPRGLFLTWQSDPTTTMTIQWLHPGDRLPFAEGGPSEPRPFAVPRVGQVEIDGNPSPWWDRGLAIEFFADDAHGVRSPEEFEAEVRLGWNEQGLLLAARVRDADALEHDEIANLWQRDSVEIFVSDGVGSDQRYQLVIAPGRTEAHPELRYNFHPAPDGPAAEDLAVRADRQIDEQTYTVEVLLPWENLPQFQAREGETMALQVVINDSDAEGQVRRVSWHPREPAPVQESKYALRLAEQAGPPARARAAVADDRDDQVTVYATRELAGRQVRLLAAGREVSTGELEADQHRSRAVLSLPEPPRGRAWGVLEVRLEDQPLAYAPGPARFGPVPAAALMYWPADGAEDDAITVTMNVLPVQRWPGQHIQRIELTDLQPDTAYRFRAVGERRDYGFRTMPAALNRPLRIAVGGDTRHRQEWMERTNRAAMRYNPDFIVWGGDLAYADGRQDRLDRWEEWFQANDNTLIDDEGNVVPIIVAIGNHEVRGGYVHRHEDYQQNDAWRLRIAPYFYQLFAFPGQPGYSVLDFGDYLSLVILDTDHSNPVEGEQTSWLEGVLSERQNVPHVFPVYHVPGYPSHRPYEGATSVRVREQWVPLFDRYGVRVAFENHDHTYKRTHPIRAGEVNEEEGVVYVGDGAWGVGTRPVHDPAETWYLHRAESVRHAIIMTLEGENRSFVVVSEDGEVIDEW